MPLYVVESTIETGYWDNTIGDMPRELLELAWKRSGEYRVIDGVRAPNRHAAYWQAKKQCNYGRLISQFVRKPSPNDYRTYLVREGDGNMGTYKRGTISAVDMAHAVRIARRTLLSVPRNAETDGDDRTTYICTYGRGDYCPYVAEVSLED